MKRHITLIGFMAAGKTTIGKKLARRLRRTFQDTDAIVASERGPIAEIFAIEGETAFRTYESAAVARALQQERPTVVALGGGALTQPENRALVDELSYAVFLKLSPERILARVQSGSRRRPMLGSHPTLETVTLLYEARRDDYERADLVVDAERMNDLAIVENILTWLHEKRIAFPH